MNLDLKNFIDQARTVGKSDEVIKQELSKAGWQGADISEAFSTAPVASSLGVAPVGASLISGKIIAAVVAVLLILGAGGYFILSKKSSPSPSSGSSTQVSNGAVQKNQSVTHPLTNASCESFFSFAQLSELSGVTESSFNKNALVRDAIVNRLDCDYGQVQLEIWSDQKNHNIQENLLGCGLLYKVEDCQSFPGGIYAVSIFYMNSSSGHSSIAMAGGIAGPYDFSCTYKNETWFEKAPDDSEKAQTINSAVKCVQTIQQNINKN